MIGAYRAALDKVDLPTSQRKVTRHDVKARIEFALPDTSTHKAMTSRDLTENIEQLQIQSALKIIRDRGGRE